MDRLDKHNSTVKVFNEFDRDRHEAQVTTELIGQDYTRDNIEVASGHDIDRDGELADGSLPKDESIKLKLFAADEALDNSNQAIKWGHSGIKA